MSRIGMNVLKLLGCFIISIQFCHALPAPAAVAPGSLKVTLMPPEAAASGAKWVDVTGWSSPSGKTETNIPPGTYTIRFVYAPDWLTPLPTTVTIRSGELTELTATYRRPLADLSWTTKLGDEAGGRAIAISPTGDILVAGNTDTPGWVSGGDDTTFNGSSDACVIKLSPIGQVIWSTYLGGFGEDDAAGIAVDAKGNAYVTGTTSSSGWTSSTLGSTTKGYQDAFLAKLSPAGQILWSRLLGGDNSEDGTAVAVDASGTAYVCGKTLSGPWFTGGYNTDQGSDEDGFVVAVSTDGQLLWGTYLGNKGYGETCARAITLDHAGNICVAGNTRGATGFVSGGYDTTGNGWEDGFVVKLTPAGRHLWSTCCGGSRDDLITGVAVDSKDNIYACGLTGSEDWVVGGADITQNGWYDAFIVKMTPAGQHAWSTFLGGARDDEAWGIAVDSTDHIYVAGVTGNPKWVKDGFVEFPDAASDSCNIFVADFSSAGKLLWSTTLGEGGILDCYGIASSGAGQVCLTGFSNSDYRTIGELLVARVVDLTQEPRRGAVHVTLGPDDPTLLGAMWRRGATWHFRGSTAVNIPPGTTAVDFDWVYGWTTPPRQYVTIREGQTAQVTATYQPVPGALAWGSYLGGSQADACTGVACDGSGNVYVCGYTESSGWITYGDDTTQNGGRDGFVIKMKDDGMTLWSTYLGGSGQDACLGVAADRSGNCLVTGATDSSSWIGGGYDTTLNGSGDGFVVKLSPTGQHLWSTCLGGAQADVGRGIAADSQGCIYVTGTTLSPGWLTGGYDVSYGGAGPARSDADGFAGGDGFAVKLGSDGHYLWGTYLGGADTEFGTGVAVDASNNVYLAGTTYSNGWVSGGYDTVLDTLAQGNSDAYLVKLSASGKHLWSTYLGGKYPDCGNAVAVDRQGNVLVAGKTLSNGWISGDYENQLHGKEGGDYSDGFVAKLSSAGTPLWSTYLGDQGDDCAQAVAADPSGNVFVTGYTSSEGWMAGGADLSLYGAPDAFVLKLSPGGQHVWSSFLGGYKCDQVNAIAVSGSGAILVSGWTEGGGFPAPLYNDTFGGIRDGFVGRVRDGATAPSGTLRVEIVPAAAGEGRWRLTGTSSWLYPGDALPGVPAGYQTVEFKTISPDWIIPACVRVLVQSGKTSALSARYVSRLDVNVQSSGLTLAANGESVSLTVNAAGLAPFTYQWKRNGVNIAGATGATLNLARVCVTDDATYTCEVNNAGAVVQSAPLRVVIDDGVPVIRYLLGYSSNPAGLDLDGNGQVTIADALWGIRHTAPEIPSAASPASGATGVALQPTLDWQDCARATVYDLYLWPAGSARPATPSAAGNRLSRWAPASALASGKSYQWQVVAHGVDPAATSSGPVWTFTTK